MAIDCWKIPGNTNSHVTKELRKSLSKVGFFSVLKATRPKAKSVDFVKKIPCDRFSLQQGMRKVRLIASSNKGLMHTTFDLLLEAILRDKEMRMVGNWSIGKSISMIQVRGGPLLCRYHFPCPNSLLVLKATRPKAKCRRRQEDSFWHIFITARHEKS